MSKKSAKIAEMISQISRPGLDPHYAGYFDLFNRQLFYEAHDVLEELWLPVRKQPEGDFYKGLIQLAGAFVHLQKNRLKPAHALLTLAETNLLQYPSPHEQLELGKVLELIADWKNRLQSGGFEINPYRLDKAPRLMLLE